MILVCNSVYIQRPLFYILCTSKLTCPGKTGIGSRGFVLKTDDIKIVSRHINERADRRKKSRQNTKSIKNGTVQMSKTSSHESILF